jgi:hypothetical protein
MTSMPSASFTPWINFGNWLWLSFRHRTIRSKGCLSLYRGMDRARLDAA